MVQDSLFGLIVSILEISQALLIGGYFIYLSKKRDNYVGVLGGFLISYGIMCLFTGIEIEFTSENNTYYKLLPFSTFFLIPTLLYLYVYKISTPHLSKKVYFIFVPSVLEFTINVVIYLQPLAQKLVIEDSLGYLLYEGVGFLGLIVFLILIFRRINRYKKELLQSHSNLKYKTLDWIQYSVLCLVFGLLLSVLLGVTVPFFNLPSEYFENTLSLFELIIIYWITFNGLHQQVVYNLVNDSNHTQIQSFKSFKKNDLEKLEQVFSKIQKDMQKRELFLDPELNLASLGHSIHEPPRLVSAAINTIGNENFNTYINKLRIENI